MDEIVYANKINEMLAEMLSHQTGGATLEEKQEELFKMYCALGICRDSIMESLLFLEKGKK